MSSLFLIFLSSIDSGIRFLATFVYQTNADQQSVSALYKFLVYSNFFCVPFLVLIPVTYRFAHFGELNRMVSNIYIHLLFFLMITYYLVITFVINDTATILRYSMFYGFCLATFGTLISILNVQGKLQLLQILKVCLGCIIASILIIALIFKLSYLSIFKFFIISIFAFCAIAAAKVNFRRIRAVKLHKLYKWIKLAIYRYRGATINTVLLLIYSNIDRLIVTNVSDDSFINQYAISTTISAPILVIANVLQLRYWPAFAKKGSRAVFKKQLLTLMFVSLGLSISCICVYLLMLGLELFPDRLPSLDLYILVVFYYSLYPVTQFILFYSGLKRPSLINPFILVSGLVIAFFLTTSVSYLIFTLPLLALMYLIIPIISIQIVREK